jgi:hypothetical protein
VNRQNPQVRTYPQYDRGRFTDIADTPLGQELWIFLNERDNVLRMVTASELGQPAVAALAQRLLDSFGASVRAHRYKRMIGHMVRQIMEQEDFVLDAQNVRVRVSDLFSRASRYTRYQASKTKGQ